MRKEQVMTTKVGPRPSFLFVHGMHSNALDLDSSGLTSAQSSFRLKKGLGEDAKVFAQKSNALLQKNQGYTGEEKPQVKIGEDTEETRRKIQKRLQKVSKLKHDLMQNDIVEAILGIFSLVIALLEYDLFFEAQYTETETCRKLRIAISFFTSIGLVLAIRHSWLSYKLNRSQGKEVERVSFVKSSFFQHMIIECVFVLVHNMPGVNYIFVADNAKRPV